MHTDSIFIFLVLSQIDDSHSVGEILDSVCLKMGMYINTNNGICMQLNSI